MQVTIESAELTTRTSQQGKPYYTQTAYIHLVNKDGSPKRYPYEVDIFPDRDNKGNPVPYKPGEYQLHDNSFDVEKRGPMTSLVLVNVNLLPINRGK